MAKRDKNPKTEPTDKLAATLAELKAAKKTIRRLEADAGDTVANALEMAKIKVIIDHHLDDFDIDLEAEMQFVVGLSLGEDGKVTGEAVYRPQAAKGDGDEEDGGEGAEVDDPKEAVAEDDQKAAGKKAAKQSRRVKAKPPKDVRAEAKAFFDRRHGVEQ